MKRKYFLLLCLLLLGICSAAAYADATIFKRHSTGLRKPNSAEQSYMASNVRKLTSVQPNKFALGTYTAALENDITGIVGISTSAIIHLRYLPPTGNQGELGSCAAWASCYYVKTYEEAQEHGWTDLATNAAHQMSPAFGYNLANDGVDAGSAPDVIMQLMCDHGCTTMADMPVTAKTIDYISWPATSMWKSAINYRGDTASTIDLSTNSGIAALKQWVANDNVAVVGVEAFENLEFYPLQDPYDSTITISTNSVLYANPGVPYVIINGRTYSTDEGGHALTVIGYDDTITFYNNVTHKQESGAFLLINQWGTDWGINISTGPMGYAVDTSTGGFIWMSYNYLQNLSVYKEAYVVTDRTAYSPTTFGTFTLDHPSRGCLDVEFIGGTNKTSPDWSFNCLPYLGGDKPVNQQIYIDLTSYNIDYGKPVWLGVYDSSSTSYSTGRITGMTVEKADGTIFTPGNVSQNTVKSSIVYVEMNQIAMPTVTTLNLPGSSVSVDVPGYSFSVPVNVLVTSITAPSTPVDNIIFTGLAVNVDSSGHQPTKLVTIKMSDNNLPASININRLAIAYYDSANNRWVPLSSTLGKNNQVSCLTNRLSCVFALVELSPSSSLASVKAYPNPYKLNSFSQGITIANLTPTSEIKIYNVAGELVRTLDYSNGSGRVMWDARNDSGNPVGSGVYIIFINSPQGTQKLKVAIEK
jgi:C1A family cysteine protease